ncbi:hypothetical protein Rhopal_000476-T1 [Rhodotorula paludigena]|uniref:PhoX domain-containing protein n=1 Tax=Rhodotorula paludigena TaxID=86838 RepID=A0AAV5GD14_9BASI|nr:hypothetical protein Rhopal_000476-T1 [Rhodotorula paludigena]
MTQTKAAWEAAADSSCPPLRGAPPFLQAAVDSLLALILRDFVLRWYSSISDSPVFPHAVDRTIRDSLVAVATRVSKVDWSEVLVGRILPLVTAHIEASVSAAQSVHGRAGHPGAPTSDELELFVASRYASATKTQKLHPAVDVASTNARPAEEAWLRSLCDDVLPLVMPERELDSAAVRVMVREIVACAVMLPVFDMLGDPDFWNRIIDDKAGAAIRDQKMVHQFREALDKQGPALAAAAVRSLAKPKSPSTAARRTEVVSVRTSPRQFDAWLKSINSCASIGDAKRLRSDVTAQIRKAKLATDGKELDALVDGVPVAEWVDYVERLYGAKRRIDRRIAKLGGPSLLGRAPSIVSNLDAHLRHIPLRDILLDPHAVTYLMEFLERRQHAPRAQFWLLVEGLKDPLEDLDGDRPTTTTSAFRDNEAAVALDDIRMIWRAYLAADPFASKPSYLATVQAFAEESTPSAVSPHQIRQVRYALFAIQTDVLALLEEDDYPAFIQSDLYFKATSALPAPPTLSQSATGPATTLTPPSPAPVALAAPPPLPERRVFPSSLQIPPLRSSTDPVLTSTLAAPLTPPPRPSSPSPVQQGISRSQTLARTDTAPPQVTFREVLNNARSRSPARRTTAPETVRKVSSSSLDTVVSAVSAPMVKRKSSTLSDSLEFLMSPPPQDSAERSPLFEPEASGLVSGLGEGEDDDFVQVETIEAIQEALNSILQSDARAQPTKSSPASEVPTPSSAISPIASLSKRPSLFDSPSSSSPDTLRPRAKAVFDDDDAVDAAGTADEEVEPDFDPHSLVVAAPGDLHLPAEIARLSDSLDKLRSQEAVVEALIRKAELTGNGSELKLLVKSRESLRREIRAASFQKDQLEAQASENELSPERTRVTIPGTTVGQAQGQSFQLYLVEVHQLTPEGSFRAGWIVTRRYSEFASLHNKLRDKYVPARHLDFPSKRLVGIWSKEFIEQRRIGLERYLQALLRLPVVCRSSELRSFLSQQTIALPKSDAARKVAAPLYPGQALRSLYRGLTSGIDDVLGTSTTSMVDTLIDRLSQQAAEIAGLSGGKVNDEDLLSGAAAATVRGGEEGLTYFTAPICDLFITIFQLKEANNWLRRQAILIVLQQVLGGTIERKVRDSVKTLLAPPQLVTLIQALQVSLWPNGELRPKSAPRTAAEKAATKESAARKLLALMPEAAANLIGRHNAKQGARCLFAVLQNRRLNKHLMYSVLDEILAVLFPELQEQRSRPLFLS